MLHFGNTPIADGEERKEGVRRGRWREEGKKKRDEWNVEGRERKVGR